MPNTLNENYYGIGGRQVCLLPTGAGVVGGYNRDRGREKEREVVKNQTVISNINGPLLI